MDRLYISRRNGWSGLVNIETRDYSMLKGIEKYLDLKKEERLIGIAYRHHIIETKTNLEGAIYSQIKKHKLIHHCLHNYSSERHKN